MKKKKYKGYVSLKEARAVARAVAREMTKYWYTDIYQESDGSYSVSKGCDGKAKYLMSIDKSGGRYVKKMVNSCFGKRQEYVRVK